ncbi:YobI family P-loop NTPase [Nocardioides sp. URHA0020]|uniref:YobI family P-loop NTPase n=1 Tax=Nocardioides sp. URHA0020 TaxID=1380392 RepID=UPI0012DEE362|nr:hypothetical protein [Nocardioides sp. URHA0020]
MRLANERALEGDTVTNGSEQEHEPADTSENAARSDQRSDSGARVAAPAGLSVEHVEEGDADGEKGRSAGVPLRSLTPEYEAERHETYLRRLEEALKDPRNHNIALTGRYGAGKSSVLDKFEENHRDATQRLAISTLAPGEQGESTTNRIQKEVVKQLLYGASRKVGKNSRFSRIAVLSKRRVLAEAVAVVGAVGLVLVIFGWLPELEWPNAGAETWKRATAWCVAAAVGVAVVAVVRVLTYGWFISDVGAGGATVTLTSKESSSTFFDKYLDEIVHYFDRESKDIVIFEDLDRFEDPGIFEAVRELNILLNDTPRRRARRRGNVPGRALHWVLKKLPGDLPGRLTNKLSAKWSRRLLGLGVPLRFVYAVKDSMFEKLGADTKNLAAAGEAAAAETLRANRTKFFDIVIPIVPFISHRNARELLSDLLAESGITGIDRPLVGLVSQNSTDMRLLRNMCNEYLVFAERLLESKETAPGLEPSKLFALVAYKNFHLEDFENISRRDSDLDRLYDFHQQLVRNSVAANEKLVRDLKGGRVLRRTREDVAKRIGDRLTRYVQAEHRASQYSNWTYVLLTVGSATYSLEDATSYKFWAAVAEAGAISVSVSPNSQRSQTMNVVSWARADLEVIVPEGLDANQWSALDERSTRVELAQLGVDIGALRSADFKQLAALPAYKLNAPMPLLPPMGSKAKAPAEVTYADQTFAQLVRGTMKSQLARDLVLRGYLDRNFSLYAAQFYGHFSGTDVANFMVHHVQTNTMNIDYNLRRPGAVENLLTETEEAGEEFTTTVAAYNIDLVNYLLVTDHPGATGVVKRLVTDHDDDARTFLTAYFTSGARREALAARLTAQPWRAVFEYLTTDTDVPDDARPDLVGAALAAAHPGVAYDLPPVVGDFITANYAKMTAFTEPLLEKSIGAVVTMLEDTGVRLPDLSGIDDGLCDLVIERDRYLLTGTNLRIALGVDGEVPLDRVVSDEIVYSYCLANPSEYLAAVKGDSETKYTVRRPETLVKVLTDAVERWSETQLEDYLLDLVGGAAEQARISQLRTVPKPTWGALATAGLFDATLPNVERYRELAGGDIHPALAALLEAAGAISDVNDGSGDEFDSNAAAVAILNAATFSSTKARVDLASTLSADFPLAATDIVVEPSDLFARMLTANLVADSPASFEHFHSAGWDAIKPAIKVSTGIETFLSPDLVLGMVDKVLADPTSREKLGDQIVSNAEAFVPESDVPALRAVAQYAGEHGIALRPETVRRIAAFQAVPPDQVLGLLAAAVPIPSAAQIVDVFTVLGGQYAKVASSGAKFHVAKDEIHTALLTTLRQAGVISPPRKKPGKDIYDVKVT